MVNGTCLCHPSSLGLLWELNFFLKWIKKSVFLQYYCCLLFSSSIMRQSKRLSSSLAPPRSCVPITCRRSRLLRAGSPLCIPDCISHLPFTVRKTSPPRRKNTQRSVSYLKRALIPMVVFFSCGKRAVWPSL